MLSFNVHGVQDANDIEDEKARQMANAMYAGLEDAGFDVKGVAPVLRDPDAQRGGDGGR